MWTGGLHRRTLGFQLGKVGDHHFFGFGLDERVQLGLFASGRLRWFCSDLVCVHVVGFENVEALQMIIHVANSKKKNSSAERR